MEIEKIIYNTTREIYNVEDKLSIATIFIFCFEKNSELFAELLYTNKHEGFLKKMNEKYYEYEINFKIRLDDKNVRNSFFKTLEEVKNRHDKDKYYKALFDKDEYALVISKIVNYNFSTLKMKKLTKKISKQLSLFN